LNTKTGKLCSPLVPSLSLFSGAGGLDLGLREAGFFPHLCVEVSDSARETLQANCPNVRLAEPGDIHQLSMKDVQFQSELKRGEVGLIFGGPPCQPFSKAALWHEGKVSRLRDPRARTLHAMMDAVDHFLPDVVLLENVTGFVSKGRNAGITYIQRRLKTTNEKYGTLYRVSLARLNAVDFGVPQGRERVFLIAERAGKQFVPPAPTHFSQNRSESSDATWRTAWDAIGHLAARPPAQELQPTGKWADLLPTIPEGNNYLWHTSRGGGTELFGWRRRYWTFLLKLAKHLPSWTIQADPGPATGPFHWANRRLSIQEMAALQTFPPDYKWLGSHREIQAQIGNAVPPALAAVLGAEMVMQFFGAPRPRIGGYIPLRRDDCPDPEPAAQVPRRYCTMKLDCSPHPGTGQGPRALELIA
jgi:DNA (cytosine-5)-methyltransferase 1